MVLSRVREWLRWYGIFHSGLSGLLPEVASGDFFWGGGFVLSYQQVSWQY